MSEKITLNYASSLIINKVCEEILYENKTNPDGTISRLERAGLPFRLVYRLSKDYAYIQKDVYNFEKWRTQLLATYGELVTDDNGTQQVKIVDPEKKKMFINSLNKILATEVTHSITRIDPSDLDTLDFKSNLTPSEVKIFLGFFCAEPELIKELNTEIDFDFGDLTGDKEVELKKEDNDKDTTKEISDNNNENETNGSEVKKTRKTTRKKTTTKTSKSKKTTTEEKE